MITEEQFKKWKEKLKEEFEFHFDHRKEELDNILRFIDNLSIHSPQEYSKRNIRNKPSTDGLNNRRTSSVVGPKDKTADTSTCANCGQPKSEHYYKEKYCKNIDNYKLESKKFTPIKQEDKGK